MPTRVVPLLFAAILGLALAATPALADPGPGSGHRVPGGSGSSGPGSGHKRSDDRAELPRLSTAPTAWTATAPTRSATTPSGSRPTAPTRPATSPATAATASPAAPGLAAVTGVAGGLLLVAAIVTAGFRARARLGRLG